MPRLWEKTERRRCWPPESPGRVADPEAQVKDAEEGPQECRGVVTCRDPVPICTLETGQVNQHLWKLGDLRDQEKGLEGNVLHIPLDTRAR